ncbi:MAG TPA: recombinase family protein [Blastocatellia bacterium]|nr:recombinase family protein [Blastocatellia bacterium]
MKIAALYARVSSDRQHQQGTIASQLAALEQFARERDYQVAPQHVFQDDGYSGANLDRPALDRLRKAVLAGEIEAIIALSPDRLARHFPYQYVLVEELQQAGCRVIFTQARPGMEGLKALGEKPEERMLEQMKSVFAEYERAQIAERCRRGRLHRARQGEIWLARAPYGYSYAPRTETCSGKLVINEEEAAVVRMIYSWLVDEQLPTYQIIKRLNQSGVRTRSGNERWAAATIGGIFRNPVYAGTYYYNCRQKAEVKISARAGDRQPKTRASWQTRRPKEEWIGISVPAIIARQTWDQAQEQRRVNRERAPRNNKRHEYLLRGLLVCGCCQVRMYGVSNHGVRRYQCSRKETLRVSPEPCPNRTLSAAQIEEMVWQSVSELLRDPKLLVEQYQLRAQTFDETPAKQEQRRLARKLLALKREEERLIDAYQAGIVDLNILKERRARIAEEVSRLETRQMALEAQIEQQEQQQSLLNSLEEFTRSIQGSLDNPSFETKQKILRLVVDKIEFKEDEIGIKHLIPISNARLQLHRFQRAVSVRWPIAS